VAASFWTSLHANDKMTEVKARMDKRDRETDATFAAEEADWAENDALNAIAFADAQASRAR
jgi:hypothetical protein